MTQFPGYDVTSRDEQPVRSPADGDYCSQCSTMTSIISIVPCDTGRQCQGPRPPRWTTGGFHGDVINPVNGDGLGERVGGGLIKCEGLGGGRAGGDVIDGDGLVVMSLMVMGWW